MKIPRYNAQVELTKQAPGVMVDASAAGQQARAMGEIGNIISGIGEKMQAIKTSVQEDEGKIVATKLINDAKFNADKEDWSPEYETNRQKEIDSIRKSTLDSVKDPQARQNVGTWLELNLAQLGGSFRYTGNKKLISYQTDLIDERVFVEQERYIKEDNPLMKEAHLKQIEDYLQQKQKLGVITEGDRLKNFKEIKSGLYKKQIVHDINLDMSINLRDSYVYQEIRKGKNGVYQNMPDDIRISYIDEIQRKVKLNQDISMYEKKKDQDTNEKNMLDNLVDKKLDSDVIKMDSLSGDIRPEFGNKIKDKLYNNPNVKTNPVVYNKIKNMQLMDSKQSDVNDSILDGFDNLDIDDKKNLINGLQNMSNKNKTIVRYNADGLKEWTIKAIGDIPYIYENAIYDFYKRVERSNADGIGIDGIAQEIQKEIIKQLYSPTALMEDVPNFVYIRGKLRKVYEKESKLKSKDKKFNKQEQSRIPIENVININDL